MRNAVLLVALVLGVLGEPHKKGGHHRKPLHAPGRIGKNCYKIQYVTKYITNLQKIGIPKIVYKTTLTPKTVFHTVHQKQYVTKYSTDYEQEYHTRYETLEDLQIHTQVETVEKSLIIPTYITKIEHVPSYVTETEFVSLYKTVQEHETVYETLKEPRFATATRYKTKFVFKTKYVPDYNTITKNKIVVKTVCSRETKMRYGGYGYEYMMSQLKQY